VIGSHNPLFNKLVITNSTAIFKSIDYSPLVAIQQAESCQPLHPLNHIIIKINVKDK